MTAGDRSGGHSAWAAWAPGLVVLLLVGGLMVATHSPSLEAQGPHPDPRVSGSDPRVTAAAGTGSFPTPIHHVFIVVLENAKRSTVYANGPFEKSLSNRFAEASHYYAVCHPSAPNYLGMTSGKAWQCGSDSYSTYTTENLGDLAQKAGLSWDGYMESMPSACDTTNSYPYAVKHNPFVYYKDIVNNASECKAHVVPFTNWTGDVKNGTIPALGFFTPNLKNDGHDTGVAYADSWLKGWLPPLMNDSFYNSSVFFIVYDESVNDNTGYNSTAGGNVYFTAVSPYAKKGYTDGLNASHYSLLATTEWLLGLGNTGNNDSSSKFLPMKQLFSFGNSTALLAATATASPTTGTAPLTVSFAGGATGGTRPVTYAWSFGDGSKSSTQNPSHTYSVSGSYTATLTVDDSLGVTASASVAITASNATSTKLTASATATPTSGVAPLVVNLKGSESGGTGPYNWSWTSATGGMSKVYARNATHTFSTAGSYNVTLTVRDAKNATAASVVTIVVKAASSTFSASATANCTGGAAPLSVSFNGSASGGSAPYVYKWTFGGTKTSGSQNPTHVYLYSGTYTVTLTVTDAAAAVAKASLKIVVTKTTTGGPRGIASPAPGQLLPAGTTGTFVRSISEATSNAALVDVSIPPTEPLRLAESLRVSVSSSDRAALL